MFEILEIQRMIESKARITLIPEHGAILSELLAAASRAPEAPSMPPLKKGTGAS